MESVANSEVTSTGGRHSIRIGVVFQDPEESVYKHQIMWLFEPTLATDSQTPLFEVRGIRHKKYWEGVDIDIMSIEPDEAEEVHSHGWSNGPYSTETIPETIGEKLAELFGSELSENTMAGIEDGEEVNDIPAVPEKHQVEIHDICLKVDGSYAEELDEDDPLVGNGHFTSHMKDAETGEILHTSHYMEHSMSWWFEPAEDGGLQIRKCFHKTWDDAVSGGFEVRHEGVELVESYREGEGTPDMETLPDEILSTLMDWVGEPLVSESLEGTERELPKYAYECFDCGEVSEVTPRNACPECGSESTCRYESMEMYEEAIADESEEEREVKEFLAGAEVSVSLDEQEE